jgi:hypothetical protein
VTGDPLDLRIDPSVAQSRERHGAGARRLSIWSGPRNVSTALMYAFRQRSDTIVFDEPLYAHYLSVAQVDHPGRRTVLDEMDTVGERVVDRVLLGNAPPAGPGTLGYRQRRRPGAVPAGPHVRVYKNMAHHMKGLRPGFLSELENAILTRDPHEMLPSLAEKIAEPTLADTGLAEQVALLSRELSEGRAPVVIDATRLLQDPEDVLRRVCAALELPWEAKMLSWSAGPKPEDGVWAEHWYQNVHASTGFAPYRPPEAPFPERLEPLLEASRPLYAFLAKHAV